MSEDYLVKNFAWMIIQYYIFNPSGIRDLVVASDDGNCTTLRFNTPIVIPNEFNILMGKIKAVISPGHLKEDLIKRLDQVKKFLQNGLLLEAIISISTMIEKVNHLHNASRNQSNLNLVLRNMIALKQKLLDLQIEELNNCNT